MTQEMVDQIKNQELLNELRAKQTEKPVAQLTPEPTSDLAPEHEEKNEEDVPEVSSEGQEPKVEEAAPAE